MVSRKHTIDNQAIMTIKIAPYNELSTEQLYKILRLRAEVFVVEQNCPYQDLDNRDQNAWHLWLEEDGEVLACLRVFKYDEIHSQIGRVITSLRLRGKGYGALIFGKGVELSEEKFPGAPILIHSQAYAKGFYEKFGFKVSSEEFLEDGIPHCEMIRPANSL